MKKLIALLLCVLSIASLAACGSTGKDNSTKPSSSVEIPSPFQDCDTMEDAAAISGFDMTAPENISGYSNRTIQAIENDMIQVIYENDDDNITIRKAVGTDDISGDSTEYTEVSDVDIDDLTVTLKGADGKTNVAVWTNNGYAYSITSTSALDKITVSDLVSAVNNDSNAGAIGGDPATWGPADDKTDDTQIPSVSPSGT
jgi:ABC-type oligopeptide transport system substrate-binding subunit